MRKDILIATLLIIIPILLLVFCYRSYAYNQCKNDMKCLKNNFMNKLNNLNSQLKNTDRSVEPFIGSLGSWFSNTSPTDLPVSSGIVGNENLSILEKKLNDKVKTSNTFPPTNEINGNVDDFKDSDNSELLNNINGKSLEKKFDSIPNNKVPVPESVIPPKDKKDIKETLPPVLPTIKLDKKTLFGSCQFFNDKCPDKHTPLGNFSIQGIGNGNILTCGNIQNTKPAHAIAKIKNNAIYEIYITDPGHGFNPSSPPKVSIEGGKGHGATAEAVVDDDGYLKLIKVIHPGYNYTDTPNVLIDAPFMNSSCHLCCKDE